MAKKDYYDLFLENSYSFSYGFHDYEGVSKDLRKNIPIYKDNNGNYYKENEKIKNVFKNIIVEGNNNFSIIKNIPDIKIREKNLV